MTNCKQESRQNSQARQLVRYNQAGKIVQDDFNRQTKVVTFWTVLLGRVCKHKVLPSRGGWKCHWLSTAGAVCGLCRHDVKSSLSSTSSSDSPFSQQISVTFSNALRVPGLEMQQEEQAAFYTKLIEGTEVRGLSCVQDRGMQNIMTGHQF